MFPLLISILLFILLETLNYYWYAWLLIGILQRISVSGRQRIQGQAGTTGGDVPFYASCLESHLNYKAVNLDITRF